MTKSSGSSERLNYGIHDISRLVATEVGQYSRFNLPFELGIDRGAQLFGSAALRKKRVLVLDAEPYDYRRALSDLAGSDIKHHRNDPPQLVRAVRNWFVETANLQRAPSGTAIWYRFTDFAYAFYEDRRKAGFADTDLDFMPVPEYISEIRTWLRTHE